MKRLQLHITDPQDRRLRALAKKRRLSRAELIREAIEAFLARNEDDPLLSLIGAGGQGGLPDASENLDTVVYGPFEHGDALPAAAETLSPLTPK